jgi:TetR/AcrR family transcriptional regulator
MSDARERILQAAIEVFSKKGYAGAGTREIASLALVHQPAIAYHFKNKEMLWKESVSSMWTTLLSDLKREMKSANPRSDDERIEVFANFYVRHLAQAPESVMMVVQEGAQTDDRGLWFNETWIKPMARALYETLAGSKWVRKNRKFEIKAVSILSILTGSTLIFSQRSQLLSILDLDTRGDDFVNEHVKTVTQCLKALLLNP